MPLLRPSRASLVRWFCWPMLSYSRRSHWHPANSQWLEQGAPFMTSDAPARSPLNVEISAKIPTAILDAAIGTLGRDKVLMVRVEHQFAGRLLVVPLAHLSTLRFVEQCQSTASRFFGQCQHTDLIGLCWASLRRPVGTYGDNVQWAASGGHHPSCQRASTRSFHNELWVRWNRNPCWVVLRLSHWHPASPC